MRRFGLVIPLWWISTHPWRRRSASGTTALIFLAHAFAQAAREPHSGGSANVTASHSFVPEPKQSGQAAFAAVQKMIDLLNADLSTLSTHGSKLNLEALREYLINVDNVPLRAAVKSEPIEVGMFEIAKSYKYLN